ncbi:unnamed protein product [Oppiella nova]|uniref:Uncharacterized protein n=1 Tax=Oppiella nova TaxID=334625 RepID=A0A7R9QPE6_9ACAR|nr:unnamed protein product [Oppiella nova]CAG2169475.1 unnamed protein product [Oppiella nova]
MKNFLMTVESTGGTWSVWTLVPTRVRIGIILVHENVWQSVRAGVTSGRLEILDVYPLGCQVVLKVKGISMSVLSYSESNDSSFPRLNTFWFKYTAKTSIDLEDLSKSM